MGMKGGRRKESAALMGTPERGAQLLNVPWDTTLSLETPKR